MATPRATVADVRLFLGHASGQNFALVESDEEWTTVAATFADLDRVTRTASQRVRLGPPSAARRGTSCRLTTETGDPRAAILAP
jgi:hypothetical protein